MSKYFTMLWIMLEMSLPGKVSMQFHYALCEYFSTVLWTLFWGYFVEYWPVLHTCIQHTIWSACAWLLHHWLVACYLTSISIVASIKQCGWTLKTALHELQWSPAISRQRHAPIGGASGDVFTRNSISACWTCTKASELTKKSASWQLDTIWRRCSLVLFACTHMVLPLD